VVLHEKEAIAPHKSDKVPVLLDAKRRWSILAIANYSKTAIRTGRRCSGRGRPLHRADAELVGAIWRRRGNLPMIIADIPLNLKPVDAAYFRKSARRASAGRWRNHGRSRLRRRRLSQSLDRCG